MQAITKSGHNCIGHTLKVVYRGKIATDFVRCRVDAAEYDAVKAYLTSIGCSLAEEEACLCRP